MKVFFFKRKTADEMRISAWSSYLCSSDLRVSAGGLDEAAGQWDIIINATSSSLSGAAPQIPGATYAPESLAYDLVYAARPTPFMLQSNGLGAGRSEEHTSELQSLMRISYAVFCLKKKKNNKQHIHITHKAITRTCIQQIDE